MTAKILSGIQKDLKGKNHFPGELIPNLAKWTDVQLRYGLDIEDVAEQLNNLEIPTLSGAGAWNPGNVEYLMHRLI